MIDKSRLRDRIVLIQKNVILLEDMSKTEESDFDENSIAYYAALRLLQTSIEAMIDMGNHIVSRERAGVPSTYGETFNLLNQMEVIPDSFLEKSLRMVRFRNRLVHMYTHIDPSEVRRILQSNLADFHGFIGFVVTRYLED